MRHLHHRRLRFEGLEERRLLAAAPFPAATPVAEVEPDTVSGLSVSSTTYNNHDYVVIKGPDGVSGLTWTAAEAAAVDLGGHLVTINDAAEAQWLDRTFQDYHLWIGLNDAAHEGNFVWASGQEFVYANWGHNEPNNWGGNEDYVHLSGYHWNDNSNNPCRPLSCSL